MISLTSRPPLARVGRLSVIVVLLTLWTFSTVFLETDYAWSLYNAYDEIEHISKAEEEAGNLVEAERLMRTVVWLEEKRALRNFSWGVAFSGPDRLFFANVHVARLMWKQGQMKNAERGFEALLEMGQAEYEPDDGRYMAALVWYAAFLEDIGRWPEAEKLLDQAEAIVQTSEANPPWIIGSDEYYFGLKYKRGLAREIREIRNRRTSESAH